MARTVKSAKLDSYTIKFFSDAQNGQRKVMVVTTHGVNIAVPRSFLPILESTAVHRVACADQPVEMRVLNNNEAKESSWRRTERASYTKHYKLLTATLRDDDVHARLKNELGNDGYGAFMGFVDLLAHRLNTFAQNEDKVPAANRPSISARCVREAAKAAAE